MDFFEQQERSRRSSRWLVLWYLVAAAFTVASYAAAGLLASATPALLLACVEAAMTDGRFNLAEAELVRTIATTLDCPVPPVLAAQDPLGLAA